MEKVKIFGVDYSLPIFLKHMVLQTKHTVYFTHLLFPVFSDVQKAEKEVKQQEQMGVVMYIATQVLKKLIIVLFISISFPILSNSKRQINYSVVLNLQDF